MERVFITGAPSGIGAALAKAHAARGAKLGMVARHETELQQLAAPYRVGSVALTFFGSSGPLHIGHLSFLSTAYCGQSLRF